MHDRGSTDESVTVNSLSEARQALIKLLNDKEVIDKFRVEDRDEVITVVGMLDEYEEQARRQPPETRPGEVG